MIKNMFFLLYIIFITPPLLILILLANIWIFYDEKKIYRQTLARYDKL